MTASGRLKKCFYTGSWYISVNVIRLVIYVMLSVLYVRCHSLIIWGSSNIPFPFCSGQCFYFWILKIGGWARVGYVVFSGVHTSMIKKTGNVTSKACKATVVVFLVEEWDVPVYGIFFLYCFIYLFISLSIDPLQGQRPHGYRNSLKAGFSDSLSHSCVPWLHYSTAFTHFHSFLLEECTSENATKSGWKSYRGWTGWRSPSDVLLQAWLWSHSKNYSSSWAVCGE